MKLIKVNSATGNEKIHAASKMGMIVNGHRVETADCNRNHFPANSFGIEVIEGDASQITCQRCQAKHGKGYHNA